MPNEITSLLELRKNNEWTRAIPASTDAIASVEKKLNCTFPDVYRDFLLYSDGGELEADDAFISLYDCDRLESLNPHPVWSKGLPKMIFFGDDQGSYLYYFDPQNRIGQGNWAVYGVSMGSSSLQYSMYIALDLIHLFKKFLNGVDVLNGPYMKDK